MFSTRIHRTICITVTALVVGLTGACGDERPDPLGAMGRMGGMEQPLSSEKDPLVERYGIVQLLHTGGRAVRGANDLLVANAAFVRARGVERADVTRLLGIPDLPDPSDFDAGQCVVSTSSLTAPTDGAAPRRLVELLDAGDVELRLDKARVSLPSQYYPDIVSFVSGVSYEAALRNRPDLTCRGDCQGRDRRRVTVSGTGSLDVGSFWVTLDVPPPIRVVEVGGRAVRGGTVLTDLARDMTVTWESVGGPSDFLVVNVTRYGFDTVSSVRCLAPDTGSFTVPGDLLTRLPELPGETTDRLQVRRVTMQSFDATGLDEGVAVFVNQDSVLLR